jgi:hypothetical protein
MSFIGTGFIDPKDYPFKKFIDENKHVDTDELRYQIKPIHHIIDQHFKGREHLFCDKSQLDANGKFRRPKMLIEAERRGFKTAMEMDMAEKKAEENRKEIEQNKQLDELKQENADLKAKLDLVMAKLGM